MSKRASELKEISRVERIGVSAHGNPYFRLHFSDGTQARTQINAMISCGIESSENIGVPVEIYRTDAGRVYDVKPVV